MSVLNDTVKKFEGFNKALNLKGKEAINIVGVNPPAKSHFASLLCLETKKQCIYITDSDLYAKRIFEEISFYLPEKAFYYPSKEIEFFKADATSHELLNQRLEVIEKLMDKDCDGITIMSLDALLQFTVDIKTYKENLLFISMGDEVLISEISKQLVNMGYIKEDMVEGKGQFSVRGGILDVFPPSAENPYRLEFFGDEVDSIRAFDIFTQMSVENIDSIKIGPADEEIEDRESYTSILEYFDEDAFVFFDEPKAISERAEGIKWDIEETVKALAEKDANFKFKEKYINDYYDVLRELLTHPFISFQELSGSIKEYCVDAEFTINAGEIGSLAGDRERFYEEILEWIQNEFTVIFSVSEERREKLTEDLLSRGFSVLDADKNEPCKNKINFIRGGLKKGFYYENIKYVFYGDEEIFGRKKHKRIRRKKLDSASAIRDFNDLDIGDYIVHRTHGIGQYMGIDTLEVEGKRHDYLKVKYSGDDFLYVPAYQLDLIQKYVGKEGVVRLNKMGGADFARQKSKVKESAKALAEELVSLYAARQKSKGFAFSPDTEWQKTFEEGFPFEETDDQLRSIAEVKQDMESERPMDRLLCGDVGYGKTEIALRAAFKAVMDSKQVAILAPTTVLVMQHFNTFKNRMGNFPVKIAFLSRFKTKKEQTAIIKQIKSGEIDIVIGTHRLLATDVEFKDLGLLVVDEEQRFGVKHKERIKEMRHNVDVLTLSATPIPRTLHMSMINIKDMSVLTEPPENRFPVRTVVMEYNEAIINDAIKRELSRGGQVYYIHNRISSIESTASRLKKAFPNAKVSVAHGAMNEETLEDIMMDMQEGETDILVCTTIIETGLDISNVNTIIVEEANKMGLSQLYQLKGRVGRTNRRAFAYLTYRPDRILNEKATKRLKAIKEFTEFGSGFKIAMRDLEIRGAGNILGAQQHGHMETVGYDMYCELLAESVGEITGTLPKEKIQAVVDINVEAYIPPTYIKNHTMRLDVYKKIAAIASEEDKIEIETEICDRFGDYPDCVASLISIAQIKYLANDGDIREVSLKDGKIICYFGEKMNLEAIAQLVSLYGSNFFVSAGAKPYMVLKTKEKNTEVILDAIKKLLKEYNKYLHTISK